MLKRDRLRGFSEGQLLQARRMFRTVAGEAAGIPRLRTDLQFRNGFDDSLAFAEARGRALWIAWHPDVRWRGMSFFADRRDEFLPFDRFNIAIGGPLNREKIVAALQIAQLCFSGQRLQAHHIQSRAKMAGLV